MPDNVRVEFSDEQLRFIATMALFDTPASIDFLGQLAPLPPGPLFHLKRRGEKQGWLNVVEEDLFCFKSELPEDLKKKIEEINTTDRIERLFDLLEERQLIGGIDPKVYLHLCIRTKRYLEAASRSIELARRAFDEGEMEDCIGQVMTITEICPHITPTQETAPVFLSIILGASELAMALGQFILEMVPILRQGLEISEESGDQRSRALIHLHLGWFLYVSGRRLEARDALSLGKSMVENLGDDDIMEQSFKYLGLYHYQEGIFAKAIHYLEKAIRIAETKNDYQTLGLSAILLGFSAYFSGQIHRAVGVLDSHWHQARQKNNTTTATLLRASLGVILLFLDKRSEALEHLQISWTEAKKQNNGWGLWMAGGGITSYHYLNDNVVEALKMLEEFTRDSERSGIMSNIDSPMILEFAARIEKERHGPLPGFEFDALFKMVMQEPNIHMKGVALRLRAAMEVSKKNTDPSVLGELKQSEEYLIQAGNPVQVAKTYIEMAKYYLTQNDMALAKQFARKARRGLFEAIGDPFPLELRFLLDSGAQSASNDTEQIMGEAIRIIEDLIPHPELDEFLQLLASAIIRVFKAERCGLFWFDNLKSEPPVLRSAVNILKAEIGSIDFRESLALIFEAYRRNRPEVTTRRQESKGDDVKKPAMLCLPFSVKEKVRGVLYLENFYLADKFDAFKDDFLERMSERLGSYIERIEEYAFVMNKAKYPKTTQVVDIDPVGINTVVSRNHKMNQVLRQADRVANTGATVLILGETGVGKGVMARWIHLKSHRASQGSLVVVDPTTIPENLVESELFGHEKGAFTGAISQKTGRIELAHNGTLFIDEIGEINPSIQVKLLRVLHEKSFERVGGTKSIASDFRLLAATNRDLAAEVEAGRFRKDLYFRLNVIELRIPPLRDRPEDIVPLAESFLHRYAKKYNRPGLRLTAENKASLKQYPWWGNIRELENVMERSVLMAENDEPNLVLTNTNTSELPHVHPFEDNPSLEEIQRRYIKYVLDLTNNRISQASNILRMNRTTLYSRMKKLGI